MPDKYRMQPRNIIEAQNDVERRLSKVERNPRIGNTAIDSGILSIKDGRIEIVDDDGNTVIQFGKFGDGKFGLRMLDGSGNVIMDMGKGSDNLYALRVNNAAGQLQTRMGQLASGGYGLEAANASAQLVSLNTISFGVSSSTVSASENTTSSSYTDLATFGPSVTTNIGSSGKCIVFLGAQCTVGGAVPGGNGAFMSFSATPLTSGVTVNPQDNNCLQVFDSATTQNTTVRASSAVLLTGLTAATYVFTAKYRSISGGASVGFDFRNLTVFPF